MHRPFASEAQPPDEVIATAHVISHELRAARVDHRARVLGEIALEAAAGEQASRVAVGGDEH